MTSAGGVLALLQSFSAAEIARRFNAPETLAPLPDSSAARPTTAVDVPAPGRATSDAMSQARQAPPPMAETPDAPTQRLHQTLATLAPPVRGPIELASAD